VRGRGGAPRRRASPASGVPPIAADASDLVDVVTLVLQHIWADLRRSRQPIEPTQWATLRQIARGPCTVTELARQKAVSLPTMSKSVDMIARRGWVERVVDETDRRQTHVRLTAGGRRMLADCRRRAEDVLGRRLAALGPGERTQLATSLQALRRALTGDAP
jgi:DNA-binding MarR family transcriptional regulator